MSDLATSVLEAASEGRLRVIDVWANATDIACVNVEDAYSRLRAIMREPSWKFWTPRTIEIEGYTESKQKVLILFRTKDVRLVFRFPPPSSITRVQPQVPSKIHLD